KMTADSVLASVEGTARVAIMGDEESIGTAAQFFLDHSPSEFGELVREILDHHVLGVIGLRNFDDHRNHPDQFFDTLQDASSDALAEVGLYLVSFQVRAFRRV
ncbi:MAG: hypothetical protein QF645_13395, partial [Planctomycetota bacterium]|nr:hypothetical protein [Planctomycetota bacterium]